MSTGRVVSVMAYIEVPCGKCGAMMAVLGRANVIDGMVDREGSVLSSAGDHECRACLDKKVEQNRKRERNSVLRAKFANGMAKVKKSTGGGA